MDDSLQYFEVWQLCSEDHWLEWVDKWRQAGGPLMIGQKLFGACEELPREFDDPSKRSGMDIQLVAVADDPIWQRLGDIESDGARIEGFPDSSAIVAGLRKPDGSLFAEPGSERYQMAFEKREAMDRLLEEGLEEARQAYEERD